MENYKIKVIETYAYDVEVEANNEKEALRKVKNGYKNNKEEYSGIFVADCFTIKSTKFKIVK